MTQKETAMIMSILTAAYPRFYKDQTDDERQSALKLWAIMFVDDDAKIVTAAIQAMVATLKFPPTVADVKERIRQITTPQEMTELEAWALVSQAVSRTQWQHPEKQFDKLPLLIRQTLGSANTLVEWGMVDSDVFQTVTQSNFIRSYRAKATSEREYGMLPDNVKALVGTSFKMLEGRE